MNHNISHQMEKITSIAEDEATFSENPIIFRKDTIQLSKVKTNATYRSSTKDLEKYQHRLTVAATNERDSLIASPKRSGLLPGFGDGKPYPPVLPDDGAYLVEFDGEDDPINPQNWPIRRKLWVIAALFSVITASVIGSGITTPANHKLSAAFNVSQTVSLLEISLYMLGYAVGPILWAPWSELQGRRIPMIIAAFGLSLFQIAIAAASDLRTVLICRFWSGYFGSAPLVICGAVFSDMFDDRLRGLLINLFTPTVFVLPAVASMIGSFMIENGLGWRWTEWIVAFLGVTATLIATLFLEETYPPIILVSKARLLRRVTKNWGIRAKQEEIEIDFVELAKKNFTRPFILLFTEPIVLLVTIYMSFIYSLVYLSLASYPVVFREIHGMTLGISSLPGLGSAFGTILGAIFITLRQPAYVRKLDSNDGVPIPEWRLPASIAGGACFSVGLFLFGWTGYKSSIHWIVPTLAGVLVGFGTFTIFMPLINYLIDVYLVVAASVLAANCFMRSITAAAFPLLSPILFDRMGVQWVFTLLGCLAALLFPVPIIFYYYGPKLRARSKFTA